MTGKALLISDEWTTLDHADYTLFLLRTEDILSSPVPTQAQPGVWDKVERLYKEQLSSEHSVMEERLCVLDYSLG